MLAGEFLGMYWTNGSLNLYRSPNIPVGGTSQVVFSNSAPTAGQELGVSLDSQPGPNQVQFIVDLAPANTTAPSTGASGSPVAGQALTAYPGAWNSSPTAYTYEWQSCAADGTGCAAISGATGQSYTPVSGDVGRALRVRVTASNATGGAGDPADSPVTAAVVAAPAPGPNPGPTPGPAPSTGGAGVSAPAPNTPPQPKVTLCHSGNGKNYTSITVAPEAAIDGHAKNHDDDIIPPFDYVKNGKTLKYAGQNWDAQGKAILNAGCQTPAQNPANTVFSAPEKSKVTLCHSGNGKNFTEITVAAQAALNGHAKNHSDDIIPPFSTGGTSFPGLNWDATGRAIWSNGCAKPQPVTDPVADPAKKVSLCHSAGGNKYVSIEVASAAALAGHSSEHPEDIIPPFTYKEKGAEKTFPGQNWNASGQAAFNNGCVPPAPPPSQPDPEPVVPTVSCVDVASDGSYTAYFGYQSDGLTPQTVPTGPNNYISVDPGNAQKMSPKPTTFQPGAMASAVSVSGIPSGASATWSITVGGKTSTATATGAATKCETEPEPVDFGLFAACTEKDAGGTYSVTFGYQNDNVLPVGAPLGAGNRVLVNGAGNPDRGQPAALSPGRNGNAFKVSGLNAADTVAWEVKVGGLQRVATASSTTPACAGTTPQPDPEPTPTPEPEPTPEPTPEPEPVPEPQALEPVGPAVRCVARNTDGTYNVVFGYSNPNAVTVTVPGGAANALSVSPGDPGPETRGQPTAFQPGSVGNAFTVANVPAGQEITWTVASYGTRSATAGIGYPERCAGDTPEKTPEPPPIDPAPQQQAIGVYLQCVDAGESTYSATFGYVNPGAVALTIPAGENNRFAGSNPDRGQPTVFAPGDAPEAFRITGIGINQRPSWRILNSDGTIAIAVANPSAPNCTTGNPKRGPETDVDPELPPRDKPPTPIVIEIDNPGTEIDWKPKTTIELPPNVTPVSVFDRNITCRHSGRTVTCAAARLLPGQIAVAGIRTRCVRKGSGRLGVASVVRNVSLRPGQVASNSATVRVRSCGPRYTG